MIKMIKLIKIIKMIKTMWLFLLFLSLPFVLGAERGESSVLDQPVLKFLNRYDPNLDRSNLRETLTRTLIPDEIDIIRSLISKLTPTSPYTITFVDLIAENSFLRGKAVQENYTLIKFLGVKFNLAVPMSEDEIALYSAQPNHIVFRSVRKISKSLPSSVWTKLETEQGVWTVLSLIHWYEKSGTDVIPGLRQRSAEILSELQSYLASTRSCSEELLIKGLRQLNQKQ